MATNDTVSDVLYQHPVAKQDAINAANEHQGSIHVLAQKLKEVYHRHFGGTNLDNLDWHFHAQNLLNKLRATGKLAKAVNHAHASSTKEANPGSAPATPTKTGTGEPLQPQTVTKVPGSPSGDDLGNPIRDANQIGDPTVNFKHDSTLHPGEPAFANKDNAGLTPERDYKVETPAGTQTTDAHNPAVQPAK